LESKLWDKKDVILKNETGKLLKTNDRPPKTNRNEPKNEAGKLLKIRSCGKNEPKNEPGHVVENTRLSKNERKQAGDRIEAHICAKG
jgi:hypothetical protein